MELRKVARPRIVKYDVGEVQVMKTESGELYKITNRKGGVSKDFPSKEEMLDWAHTTEGRRFLGTI